MHSDTGRQKGRKAGAATLKTFRRFLAERKRLKDWTNWTNASNSALSRRRISEACGFSRSVFLQNPALKRLIFNEERRLTRVGMLLRRSPVTICNNRDLRPGATSALKDLVRRIARLEAIANDFGKRLDETADEIDQLVSEKPIVAP
jgi:hypothetical protein